MSAMEGVAFCDMILTDLSQLPAKSLGWADRIKKQTEGMKHFLLATDHITPRMQWAIDKIRDALDRKLGQYVPSEKQIKKLQPTFQLCNQILQDLEKLPPTFWEYKKNTTKFINSLVTWARSNGSLTIKQDQALQKTKERLKKILGRP